jgi:hypothetical protein
MPESLQALLLSILLLGTSYLLFGEHDPWGLIMYFLVLIALQTEK